MTENKTIQLSFCPSNPGRYEACSFTNGFMWRRKPPDLNLKGQCKKIEQPTPFQAADQRHARQRIYLPPQTMLHKSFHLNNCHARRPVRPPAATNAYAAAHRTRETPTAPLGWGLARSGLNSHTSTPGSPIWNRFSSYSARCPAHRAASPVQRPAASVH